MTDTTTTAAAKPLLRRILASAILPRSISGFEQNYLKRINRIALGFFYAHVPVYLLIAWLNDTGPLFTLLLTAAVLVVPTVAYRTFRSVRAMSMVFGFTAMCMGGVLVHVGQGPVQIEMHFYFFSLLAMLALFANPMAILVAAATVSVHHLLLWYLVPSSVFNYDAPLWVVLVHAAFVVLETFAACFIARSFFDNVIELEKKVEQRTVEIRKRNRDMRLVLDNVQQGLVTVDARSRLSAEHSAALERWFGDYAEGETVAEYLGRSSERLGRQFAFSWESITDGFLPLELSIDQLPSRAAVDGRHFAFAYQPLLDDAGELQQMLIVVSDVTADVAQKEAEALQREILAVIERILRDRAGFLDFYDEAGRLLRTALATRERDWDLTKRSVHTLKGNAGVFGLDSIARLCHTLEDRIGESDVEGIASDFAALEERWTVLCETIDRLLGKIERDTITMTGEEYNRILGQIVDGAEHEDLARSFVDLKLEPTELRLGRFAEQARALAERLEKGDIEIEIGGNGLRLERERFAAFWGAFSHVLRNAIDHGLESPDERTDSGKPETGHLAMSTYEEGDEVVVEIRDDGRGIDWNAVRARARELDLPSDAENELREALFVGGLSTRDEVSETSGRGVGLAAVRRACDELGGSIELKTEPGRGTVFQFRFPSRLAREIAPSRAA